MPYSVPYALPNCQSSKPKTPRWMHLAKMPACITPATTAILHTLP